VKIDSLQTMLDKHLQDKNYQYRDKSWEEIDAMAQQSFSKLSPAHQLKVLKVGDKYGMPKDNKLTMRVRFMAQTNLFFLCKLLGYDAMTDQ
jgi:RNase adaptor protein for sRNA GlmZ degradation